MGPHSAAPARGTRRRLRAADLGPSCSPRTWAGGPRVRPAPSTKDRRPTYTGAEPSRRPGDQEVVQRQRPGSGRRRDQAASPPTLNPDSALGAVHAAATASPSSSPTADPAATRYASLSHVS